MTIHGAGYRTAEYEPTTWFARLWPITWHEATKLFRTKRGLLLAIMSLWYVIPKLILLYIHLGIAVDEEGQMIRRGIDMMARAAAGGVEFTNPFRATFYMDHAVFSGGLVVGFFVFLILTSVVSVRALSADRSANALEIYWTRGISPWGYFLGKWAGSLLLLAVPFVIGPLFVWVMSLFIAPGWEYLELSLGFMPQVLAALLLECLFLSFLAVAFSGLSDRPNVVTLLWTALILGSWIGAALLTELMWRHWDDVLWYKAINPWFAVSRIANDIVGVVQREPYDASIAWWWAAGYVAVGCLILWRRLRYTHAIT